jgi:hypothetical protein
LVKSSSAYRFYFNSQKGKVVINKKNVLGKSPAELGDKDAIHVAIVAVRAGKPIAPGSRVGLNEFNEAVPDEKGPGVADPFLKSTILTGKSFWLLMAQTEIPNVQHHWDHPEIAFAAPTREVKRNATIQRFADDFGLTYERLMEDVGKVVETDRPVLYSGTKTQEEVEEALEDMYDLWSEWGDESLYDFPNDGTDCCPEYRHPECDLFSFKDKEDASDSAVEAK